MLEESDGVKIAKQKMEGKMSFICKEHKTGGCPFWDNGKASKRCVELGCLDVEEIWDLRKCKCGEKPELYGEGTARQYFEEKVIGRQPMMWSNFYGYVVECPECGAITRHIRTPEMAVKAWNEEALYYKGD